MRAKKNECANNVEVKSFGLERWIFKCIQAIVQKQNRACIKLYGSGSMVLYTFFGGKTQHSHNVETEENVESTKNGKNSWNSWMWSIPNRHTLQ